MVVNPRCEVSEVVEFGTLAGDGLIGVGMSVEGEDAAAGWEAGLADEVEGEYWNAVEFEAAYPLLRPPDDVFVIFRFEEFFVVAPFVRPPGGVSAGVGLEALRVTCEFVGAVGAVFFFYEFFVDVV